VLAPLVSESLTAAVTMALPGSEQTAVLQVILDNHVRDCIEHKLYVGCVGGAGEVGVDLLQMALRVPAPVQGLEFKLYVGRSIFVRVGA